MFEVAHAVMSHYVPLMYVYAATFINFLQLQTYELRHHTKYVFHYPDLVLESGSVSGRPFYYIKLAEV